jgi:hypothetical protein
LEIIGARQSIHRFLESDALQMQTNAIVSKRCVGNDIHMALRAKQSQYIDDIRVVDVDAYGRRRTPHNRCQGHYAGD